MIGIHAFMLVVGMSAAGLQAPATQASPSQPEPAQAQPARAEPIQAEPPKDPAGSITLPVSFERIQAALSRPPAIKTSTTRPVFRVEVFSRKPTIADILGPDYLLGPVPMGGSMSHKEFLDMVTPVEYRGMSMFTNTEAMTIAATSIGLQWALMKAVDKLKSAANERAKEAARQEVITAMNELEAARKKAGLPPK